MHKCPNCNNELKQLKGTHKIAVQIDEKPNWAGELFEKIWPQIYDWKGNSSNREMLPVDDLISAVLDKDKEIEESTQDDTFEDRMRRNDWQAHAFRELVEKAKEMKK